jgi:uncharacterized Ntn-hydrolase superfamily protein
MLLATFSIVARDPATGDLGVAVASKFFAPGAVVPWVEAGVGALASQSFVNGTYGGRGLAQMRLGGSAAATLVELVAADPERALRQVGIVDATGRVAVLTGEDCLPWAGHVEGRQYCCQGNYLVGPETVRAMARTFEAATGDLPDRLVAALRAGDEAGGDRRGKQGAALKVARKGGGYGGSDVLADLRVDDHPEACRELARLLDLHNLYFGRTAPQDRLKIDGEVAAKLKAALVAGSHLPAGADDSDGANAGDRRAFLAALRDFSLVTNLDERVQVEAGTIDPPAYRFIVGGRG